MLRLNELKLPLDHAPEELRKALCRRLKIDPALLQSEPDARPLQCPRWQQQRHQHQQRPSAVQSPWLQQRPARGVIPEQQLPRGRLPRHQREELDDRLRQLTRLRPQLEVHRLLAPKRIWCIRPSWAL